MLRSIYNSICILRLIIITLSEQIYGVIERLLKSGCQIMLFLQTALRSALELILRGLTFIEYIYSRFL